MHWKKGSEYAIAWDYIQHMSRNNKLTVIYGSSGLHHDIGNTEEMESYLSSNPVDNVNFIAITPSFVSHNYPYSFIGIMKFYKEYELWHKDVKNKVMSLISSGEKYDIIHYLGPMGYREPGFLYGLNIPYIWGPIGGFDGIPLRLIKATFSLNGAVKMSLKHIANIIQFRFNNRLKKAFEECDVIICATSSWKDKVIKNISPKHHSIIINNPENCINRFYPLNKAKFGGETIKLIFVGRLDSGKALILLLEAMKKLKNKEKIHVDVIGPGDLTQKYKEWAENYNLNDYITWHGSVDRNVVFSLMNEAHLHVLPSLYDGNPTVIWESMSMCVPTLALDHFGMHDVINKRIGYNIRIQSYTKVVNDIHTCLEEIIKTPDILKVFAENILEERNKYTWAKRQQFFENAYEMAIKNHTKHERKQ